MIPLAFFCGFVCLFGLAAGKWWFTAFVLSVTTGLVLLDRVLT